MTGQVDLAMVREGHPRAIELACLELALARAVVLAVKARMPTQISYAIRDYDEFVRGAE